MPPTGSRPPSAPAAGARPSIKLFAIERAAHDFLATLVLEKLFDRFPNVRVASVENGSDFLAPLFRKLHTTTRRMPGYFREDPVVTFRRHVWINPFWEDDVDEIVDFMGDDRVIFGSDWPHVEGLPEPTDWVTELQKLPPEAVPKIMGGNVAELNERRPRPMSETVDQAETVSALSADDGRQVEPHVIVLFGATGDLAARKLLPGLLHLAISGMMPEYRIVGSATSEHSDEDFRDMARYACDLYATDKISLLQWANFERRLTFCPTTVGPEAFADHVAKQEAEMGGDTRRLHYLSVPPAADQAVIQLLADAKLVERSRVILEKPFGTDLASAVALNDTLHRVFDEEQIFRIDHFLGKEAAQNILAFRFANGLFEPIWNRDHIDNVQIDVPETLSVDDRVGFYEATGAFKDMVVTHLFQILAFMAMEPPTALEPVSISEEKNKVFRSLRPLDVSNVVRGQYEGYRDLPGVAPDSDTETFVALRCDIDNWRWAGVPFFLRTGQGDGQRRAHHLDRLP